MVLRTKSRGQFNKIDNRINHLLRVRLRGAGLIRTVEEETAVAKVLRAAAWTYVAAFITSLVYFLLHVLPLLGGRRD
jgi:Zn-dependent membrane protease YugP